MLIQTRLRPALCIRQLHAGASILLLTLIAERFFSTVALFRGSSFSEEKTPYSSFILSLDFRPSCAAKTCIVEHVVCLVQIFIATLLLILSRVGNDQSSTSYFQMYVVCLLHDVRIKPSRQNRRMQMTFFSCTWLAFLTRIWLVRQAGRERKIHLASQRTKSSIKTNRITNNHRCEGC